MTERLRIVIDGDGDGAERELKKVRKSVRDLTDEQRRSTAATTAATKAAGDHGRTQARTQARMDALTAAQQRQVQTLGSLTATARNATLAMTALAAVGAGKAVRDGFAFNSAIESSELAMRRFIGTTKETERYVANLFEVAKKTPFEFTDLTDASRKLLAFGMDAQQTMKVLRATGDAVAAAGGDPEKIQRVVMAIGQIQAKNKVYAEELLQLTEAGIPAYRILRDELGLTGEQVANIGEQGISAKVGIDALTRGMNEMFRGAAREQSTTWAGMVSTMRDSWAQMTGALTRGLFEEAKEWAPVVNAAMEDVAEVWKNEKLSLADKFEASSGILDRRLGPLFDEIEQRVKDLELDKAFADAMEKAIPVVAEGAGNLAVTASKAFFNAFREADPLTKAIIALVAAQKTGALAAITTYGRNAGSQAAAGMASGLSAGDPLAAAAGGSARSKWLATAKGVGKGVLGVGLVAGMADAITSEDLDAQQRIGRALSTATFGLLPDPKTESDKYFQKLADGLRNNQVGADEVRNALKQRTDWLERNAPNVSQLWKGDWQKRFKLNIGGESIDTRGFSNAQKKVLRDIADLRDGVANFNDRNKLKVDIDEVSSKRALDKLQFGFDQLDDSASGSISRLRRRVQSNLRLIDEAMGRDTASGKAAAVRNFNLAAEGIRKAMDAGRISTEKGLAEIRKLMVEKLQEFGFTEEQAKNIRKGNRYDGGANEGSAASVIKKAGGGWIGAPGERGRDEVPIVVGRGEAVLNHHQQRVVNTALAETGRGNLGTLFSRVKTPHYLASGGFAGGGVVEAGRRIRDMGYAVGEHEAFGGVAPVHTANSYHYKGLALDVNADSFPGGEGPALDKLASWLRREYAGKILELLWRTAGHHDHLHVAIGGSGTGGTGGMGGLGSPPEIKRVLTDMPGMLGGIGQGALDMARAAAQERVNQAFDSQGGAGEPAFTGESGAPDQVRRWVTAGMRLAGVSTTPENVAKVVGRAMQESGGNPRAINNWDSNAAAGDPSRGLMQTIMATFNAYKVKGHDDVYNPVDNVAAAVRYMMARYGHLVGPGPGGYASGGFVDALYAAAGRDGSERKGLGRTAPVAVGPAKGRKQPTTGSKKTGWKPKGLKFTGKLRNALPQMDQLYNLEAVISAMTGSTDRLGEQFDLTDENATRTLPVAQLSDEALTSLGLTAAQIAALRGSEGQDVEVLNQGAFSDGRGITEHVAELAAMIDRKKVLGGHINTKQMVANGLVTAIQAAIAERKARLQEVAERIKAVRDRIQRNTADIRSTQKSLNAEERKKKPDRSRLRSLRGKLVELRDERAHLIGHRTLDGADDPTEGSMLGIALKYRDSTRAGLRSYEDELPRAQETAGAVPNELYEAVTSPIARMAKEMGEWMGTAAPKIGIPEGGDRTGSADEIARLKAQLFDEESRKRRLAEAQFGTFQGFAPLAAQRLLGSFARGVANVPHDGMAMLHAGETVVPNPNGPFQITARDMAGGSAPNVTVVVDGDVGQFVRRVEAMVDGKVARVSEDVGRRQRLFTVAPGGTR